MRHLRNKICITCNKKFKQGYTVSDIKFDSMKFCSFKCRKPTEEIRKKISKTKKNSPTTIRGEKHYCWKGGISKSINDIRKSLEYILWRNEVYKRDRWVCRICGVHCKKGNIIAHHIKKFSEYPELRFTTDNGITLCRKCHAEIENPQHV